MEQRGGKKIREIRIPENIEEDFLERLRDINKEIRRLRVIDEIILDDIEDICDDIKEIIEPSSR